MLLVRSRCTLGAAQGITRFPRFVASGTAGRSSTTAPWRRSKTGSIRGLRDDYVLTGFRGYRVQTRAVKGHRSGLSLSEADKKGPIAFLKTL